VLLVGDARLTAAHGFALPSLDAVVSVILLMLLAALALGRQVAGRVRLISAGAMGALCVIGVLAARLTFWRLAMPLELLLGAVVAVRWAPAWWESLAWPLRAMRHRFRLDVRWLVGIGGAVALLGQAVVALHRWTPIGVVLLVVGLVTMVVGLSPDPPSRKGKGDPPVSRIWSSDDRGTRGALPEERLRVGRWQIVALVGIAALAVGLRIALLTEMPASLFRDEARHALRAIRILDDATYRPVYEPEIALPAFFLYPLALWFKVFGISLLALRLFMASVGVADVMLLFLLGRRLFGTRVGLIAAYLFAASFWALRMQRVALAPCYSTGLVLLALWLFVRAVQLRRWGDWALAGIGAAGTVYCYHSGPFALVLMALVALGLLVRAPRLFVRFWLPRLALCAGIFLILAAPLLRYVTTHLEQYTARPKQTAIFSEGNLRRLGQDRLAALEANVTPNLGMYTVRGDFEPKHNLPRAPHLDALMAVLFLLGLALALSGWLARAPYGLPRFGIWFVLGYLGVMLIPSLLAIDAPNTLRAFDTLPPALLLAAVGLEAVWARMAAAAPSPGPSPAERERGASLRRRGTNRESTAHSMQPPSPAVAGAGYPLAGGTGEGAVALVTLVLIAILALNGGTYFWRMRTDGRETLRFDTYFASQAGKRIVADAGTQRGMTFFVPRAVLDRDVFPFFVRVAGDDAIVRPLEDANSAAAPARYAILLPDDMQGSSAEQIVAALPWAKGLTRVPGNSPTGVGGVPAFIEYRTP
jgi:hypothetical protein